MALADLQVRLTWALACWLLRLEVTLKVWLVQTVGFLVKKKVSLGRRSWFGWRARRPWTIALSRWPDCLKPRAIVEVTAEKWIGDDSVAHWQYDYPTSLMVLNDLPSVSRSHLSEVDLILYLAFTPDGSTTEGRSDSLTTVMSNNGKDWLMLYPKCEFAVSQVVANWLRLVTDQLNESSTEFSIAFRREESICRPNAGPC